MARRASHKKWYQTDKIWIVIGVVAQVILTAAVDVWFKSKADEKLALLNQHLTSELEHEKSVLANQSVVFSRRLDADAELTYLISRIDIVKADPGPEDDREWLKRLGKWLGERQIELTTFQRKFEGALPDAVDAQVGGADWSLQAAAIQMIAAKREGETIFSVTDQIRMLEELQARARGFLVEANSILRRQLDAEAGEPRSPEFFDVVGQAESTAAAK